MDDKDIFRSLHQHHDQKSLPGLDDCPECRADAIKSIMRRLNDGDNKFEQLQQSMQENTRITKENSETLNDVKQIVVMGRSLFRMAGWIGNGIKWTAGLVLAVGGAWAVIEKWWFK